jgi:hypothetical protein
MYSYPTWKEGETEGEDEGEGEGEGERGAHQRSMVASARCRGVVMAG